VTRELDVGEDEIVWACVVHAYARARQKEQRPRHSITLTLHPLTQIQKTPQIYAEIFGPNLAAKLFYRSPLGVMHCSTLESH
jgi:hypothetical protein